MFTWICQKCGSEVPPSENDCPNCRAKAAEAPPQQVPQTVPVSAVTTPSPVPPASASPSNPLPTAPYMLTPPTPAAPPRVIPPVDVPPSFASAAPPPTKRASPTIVAIGSAVAILAVLAVLYLYVLPKTSEPASSTTLETPAATAGADSSTPVHPLAKYIEVTGLRIIEEGKGQVKLGYIIVNHSPADLPELKAHLTLTAGGKQFFDFPTSIPSIGPYESKDLSTSVRTQLQPYELPDWQKLTPTLRIASDR
jgi:hypothetical protein